MANLRMQVNEVVSEVAMEAAALRYLACFIYLDKSEHFPGGKPAFYFRRTQMNITPDSFKDPFARSIFEAVSIAADSDEGFDFTPLSIANRIVAAGDIQPDEGSERSEQIAKAIRTIEARLRVIADLHGEALPKGFLRVEALFVEKLKFDQAASANKEVDRIFSVMDGKSLFDKVDAAKDYLTQLQGKFVDYKRTMDGDEQVALLDKMRLDAQARMGKIAVTYPPHFGEVIQERCKPTRKEMTIISGPTGGGKSMALHQVAEWWRRCGLRVLFITTEDSVETCLIRAVARNVPGTTYREVDEGDPNNKKAVYAKMVQDWKKEGGEIVYEERPGITGTDLVNLLENKINEANAAGNPFTAIIIDYFQDIDHASDAHVLFKGNEVSAMKYNAVRLREVAQKHDMFLVIGSQETVGVDGDVHTYGSKAFTMKSQQWLRLVTTKAKDDVWIWKKFFGEDSPNNEKRMVARAGEAMPFLFMVVAKANHGPVGYKVPLYRVGPAMKMVEIEHYRRVKANPNTEWLIPVAKPLDDKFFAQQKEYFETVDATIENLNAWDYDPEKKPQRSSSNRG